MKTKYILQKIIENNGSCSWIKLEKLDVDICQKCPFNKLDKKDEINFLSCFEAVSRLREESTDDGLDPLYKTIATYLLTDLIIEEILKEAEVDGNYHEQERDSRKDHREEG